MATTERVKIDRKSLRDPDEFQILTGQATAWVRANQTLVYGVVGALFAVTIIGLLAGWYRGRQARAAAVRFESAHLEYEGAKYAEAAESFASLERDYGSTPFGRLAGLYRAHALARRGDPAAVTAYTEYLAGSPETDYLRQEALLGLARAAEAAGDTAKARATFAEAADVPGPFRIDARLGVARLAEAAGERDKAREIYTALLAEAEAGTPLRTFLESRVPAGDAAAPAAATSR